MTVALMQREARNARAEVEKAQINHDRWSVAYWLGVAHTYELNAKRVKRDRRKPRRKA